MGEKGALSQVVGASGLPQGRGIARHAVLRLMQRLLGGHGAAATQHSGASSHNRDAVHLLARCLLHQDPWRVQL